MGSANGAENEGQSKVERMAEASGAETTAEGAVRLPVACAAEISASELLVSETPALAPEDDSRKRRAYFSFAVTSVLYTFVFAAANTPSPLFATYQEALGLADAALSMATFFYLLGVMLTLLFGGRASEALGYKPLSVAAAASGMLGCFMFLGLNGAATMMLARFVQGVSCGLAMSAVSAFLIDSIAPYHLSWGSAIAGTCSCMGVVFGCLPAGLLYEATGSPVLAYALAIVVLGVLGALVFTLPELQQYRVPLRCTLKPRFDIPRQAVFAFALVALAYIGAWNVFNFFQGFSAPLAVVNFHSASSLVAALILSCASAPTVLGGPLANCFEPHKGLLIAAAAFVATCAGMLAFAAAGQLIPFYLFCALYSVAQGMCTAAGLRLMLEVSAGRSTVGVVSAINLVAYVGNALTSLGVSAAVGFAGYVPVLAGLSLFPVALLVLVGVRYGHLGSLLARSVAGAAEEEW